MIVLGSRSVTALNITDCLGGAHYNGCDIARHATTWHRYVGGIMNTEQRQVTCEWIVGGQSLVT